MVICHNYHFSAWRSRLPAPEHFGRGPDQLGEGAGVALQGGGWVAVGEGGVGAVPVSRAVLPVHIRRLQGEGGGGEQQEVLPEVGRPLVVELLGVGQQVRPLLGPGAQAWLQPQRPRGVPRPQQVVPVQTLRHKLTGSIINLLSSRLNKKSKKIKIKIKNNPKNQTLLHI